MTGRHFTEETRKAYDDDPKQWPLAHQDTQDAGPVFADPGGKSALRASSKSNPRNLSCPNCKAPNVLTPADRARGYQCDRCADRAENGFNY